MKIGSGRLFGLLPVLASMVLITVIPASAQETEENGLTQVVKGTVVDAQTQQPVPGATVRIDGTKLGGISTVNGEFRIPSVPVGRQAVRVTSIGYDPYEVVVVVTSGRQTILKVEMQQSYIQGEEIVVSGREQFAAINEAALVSSNAFTVDDVTRFAGTRDDPARMAQNFAGVVGATDLRNDIIIRGGSPTEVLWRLDDIDIPNPNHFATQGATGGPINALNPNLLANSDFFTGAFPAEYGNKLSGAFDLSTRKGNSEEYEFVAQLGFAGFEGMAEGPIPGIDNSACIASYRKSTLEVFDALGIDLGIGAVPKYEDLTLKLDIPIDDNNTISITGLGGISDISVLDSDDDSLYTGDLDVYTGTDLGVIGLNWQRLFSEKLIGKLTLSTIYSRYRTDIDSLTTDDENHLLAVTKWFRRGSEEATHALRYRLGWSPNQTNYITGGIEGRILEYKLDEQRYTVRDDVGGKPYRLDETGSSGQALGFINWNWRPAEELTLNVGVHGQYLGISEKFSIEPRAGLEWRVSNLQSFSLGFGVHRQSQPLALYFTDLINRDLDFTTAIHYVAGYTNRIAPDWIVKAEGYYKDISGAPVMADSATSFSMLNAGADFGSVSIDEPLVSNGKGRTYGAELSLIKHFTEGYYVNVTGSLIRQEYTGSDNIWRFGGFDNRYVMNLLGGYEWKVSSDFSIEFSGRYTIAGGAPYTPIDIAKSEEFSGSYEDVGRRFTARNDDYSRLDARVDFRQNFGGWALISFFYVENILNTRNVRERFYDYRFNRIEEIEQVGLFPVGGLRVEF